MSITDPYPEEVMLSPNSGRRGVNVKIRPTHIMLHHSEGSFGGDTSWIMNPASQVSYHYLIHPDDGDRRQFVYDSRRAWHAGKGNWKGNRDMNSSSVGISFTGDTYKRTVSQTEIDSCAHKCIYLMEKFNIPISNIITHQMYAPERKNDCSPQTKDRVINRIKELLS